MMKTNAKKEFKRFESFYVNKQLEKSYVERLKKRYETEELGVVKSWFNYCVEKHGKIEQTLGGVVDILEA